MTIHATAIVSKNAYIDKSVVIGPYAVIGDKVKIMKGTTIGAHTVIDGDTTIGENNVIYPFASIGQNPQDLKFNGEDTKVIIGDNNRIREFVTINKGTVASGLTKVGNNNLLMAYVHLAHDCIIGNNCVLANNATLGGHIEIGDYVVIGGLTPVHQFVKIGSHAMIGGASAVNQDVLPFVTAEGNKASTRGLNLIGLKRRGFTDEDIKVLKDCYKLIFKSSLKLNDAVEKIKEKYNGNVHTEYLIDFISKCTRGITRTRKSTASSVEESDNI